MGIINETTDLYKTIKHDKLLVIIFKTLLGLLTIAVVISIITYLVDVSNNQPAKLFWGLAEYTPPAKADSIKPNPSIIDTSEQKAEQVKYPDSASIQIKKSVTAITKHKSSIPKDTARKKEAEFDLSNAKFDAPVQVGNNNTQNNGTMPRTAAKAQLSKFFAAYPDKTTRIAVDFIGAPTAEMVNLKSQILKLLQEEGYNNIGQKSSSVQTYETETEVYWQPNPDGSVFFFIPPE